MGHLTIQNLDDATLDNLRTRAAGLHKSVEDTAAEILNEACGRGRGQNLYEKISRIRSMSPPTGKSYPSAADMVREDRDNH